MARKVSEPEKIKHVYFKLMENAHYLTCQDFVKIIKIADGVEAKVLIGTHSGQVSFDVPEMYYGHVSRALQVSGYTCAPYSKKGAYQPSFVLKRDFH